MSTYTILCDGPGPHDPADGVLGMSDRPAPHDLRCGAATCALVPPQQPLDSTGALATLLVVQGLLEIDDAANAVGLTAESLTLEAQAWAIGNVGNG